jgi:hypothetical protein
MPPENMELINHELFAYPRVDDDPDSDIFSCGNPNGLVRQLFFSSYKIDHSILDRVFWNYGEGLNDTDNTLAVAHWGIGHPGYNNTLSLAENIKQRYGSYNYFQIIHGNNVYCDLERTSPPYCDAAKFHEMWSVHGVITMMHGHELHQQRKNFWESSVKEMKFAVVYSAYAASLVQHYITTWPARFNISLAHIPFHLNPAIYYGDPYETRPYDVILTGSLSSSVYPLRDAFKRILPRLRALGIKVLFRKNPGYGLKDSAAQTREYSTDLRKASILLTCTSTRRYTLQKFMEAAGSGTFIISDLPAERSTMFRSIIGVVDRKDEYHSPSFSTIPTSPPEKKLDRHSIYGPWDWGQWSSRPRSRPLQEMHHPVQTLTSYEDYLINQIVYWVKNREERIRRATLAQQIYLKEFGMHHLAEVSRKLLYDIKCNGLSQKFYLPYEHQSLNGLITYPGHEEYLSPAEVASMCTS